MKRKEFIIKRLMMGCDLYFVDRICYLIEEDKYVQCNEFKLVKIKLLLSLII